MRADDVLEHAEDVGLELLDVRAVEHRPADADHAGPDLVDVHLRRRRPTAGGQRRAEPRGRASSEPADCHGIQFRLYGRSACWSRRNGRFVLTRISRRLLSSELPWLVTAALRVRRPSRCGRVSRRVGVVVLELRLKRHPPWPDLPPRERISEPLQPTVEEAFLFMATTPLLCVTVTAPTTAELRRQRDAVADADLVELRLDTVSDPDVAGALAGRRRPVIVTCRPAWEGGRLHGLGGGAAADPARGARLGAEYVDVEWRARFDDLDRRRTAAGASCCRPRLRRHAGRSGRARRARCARPAPRSSRSRSTATRLSDCVPLLELGAQAGAPAAARR